MPDSMFDEKQLKAGIKIEMEHTKNKKIAKEIAKDHEAEPDEDTGKPRIIKTKKGPKVSRKYYTALKKMEKTLGKRRAK